jgi:hypothetical protein
MAMQCHYIVFTPHPAARQVPRQEKKASARCCPSVTGVLPFLLPTKSLTTNSCCRVADFPEQSSKRHGEKPLFRPLQLWLAHGGKCWHIAHASPPGELSN